jgi:two-component system sensor histidine kinase PilS (NtrC family)
MVQQNALRLENIVQDVLHLTHAPRSEGQESAQLIDLLQATDRICRDWKNQNTITDQLELRLPALALTIWFDTEHLRRILINLLDNAHRYASAGPACIQVTAGTSHETGSKQCVSLRVWSNGAPLEVSVEQHLFEPFFSSASRSSGLGLYICRELCESHGATISYDRSERLVNRQSTQGNEFSVTFKPQSDISPAPATHRPT